MARILCVVLLATLPASAAEDVPRIASATSYLESAALELLGKPVPILRLAEPGTCPGHFDIRPSQAAELRRCDLLLRFDFQKSLDAVRDSGGKQPRVVAVAIHRGLCLPDSYQTACRQIAGHFVEAGWLSQPQAEDHLGALAARLRALSQSATNRVAKAGLAGAPVLASAHQKDFCEWLGLRVAGTFTASDVASIRQIDQAVKAGEQAGVRFIIANLPEGRRAADALAERLHAKVVVFGNFPPLQRGAVSFDDLLTGNVEALVSAAGP